MNKVKKQRVWWYDVNVVCREYNTVKEHEMNACAQKLGGTQTGSGFSLSFGIRDVSYTIPGLPKVKQFLKTIAPYIKVKKTTVIGKVKI